MLIRLFIYLKTIKAADVIIIQTEGGFSHTLHNKMLIKHCNVRISPAFLELFDKEVV
jgi:hypothetical protein